MTNPVETVSETFAPILEDIEQRSLIADKFIDKDLYQLYVATLWANVVLNPDDVGLSEEDLPSVHDVINERVPGVLGQEASIRSCFQFVNSKAGEAAMKEAGVTKTHRELLLYFSSMILDPEGHKRWMEEINSRER